MSLHPLRHKDLLQTLDLDLPLMLLSLTVLGVSITSSVCSQALYLVSVQWESASLCVQWCKLSVYMQLLLLLSHFSRVRLCVTP